MAKKRTQVIKVKDYGDIHVNRLAVVCDQFEKMEDWERGATLKFIESKWPGQYWISNRRQLKE